MSYLLEKYLEQFLNIINKRTRYEKFIGYIYKNSRLSANEILQFPPIQVGIGRRLKFFILDEILSILPKEIGYKSIVYKSIERLLKSSGFLNYLVETHPEILVRLTSSPSFLRIDEFTDNFFKNLIANKNSQLYREIKDNQHYMYSTGYRIEPENFILDYYFSEPENAIRTLIWKPVGNYVCDFIKQQKGKDNFYNSYCEAYMYTDEPWESPIFVGIQFFDVMVKSAIYKNKDEHMSLNYYEKFLNEILANIDRTENSKVWQEFPLKYDFLIYKLISNCSNWVEAANYLYDDDVKSIVAIESASECLGTMINKLLLSDKFDGNKKAYYLEIIVRLFESLNSKGNERLSKKIFNLILNADMYGPRKSDLELLKMYIKMWEKH